MAEYHQRGSGELDSDVESDFESRRDRFGGGRPSGGGGGGGRRFKKFVTGRRRRCIPCDDLNFDWKDLAFLSRFQTPQGRMMSRKRTGYCAQCQRQLARAIKRARFMALLPYVP